MCTSNIGMCAASVVDAACRRFTRTSWPPSRKQSVTSRPARPRSTMRWFGARIARAASRSHCAGDVPPELAQEPHQGHRHQVVRQVGAVQNVDRPDLSRACAAACCGSEESLLAQKSCKIRGDSDRWSARGPPCACSHPALRPSRCMAVTARCAALLAGRSIPAQLIYSR